MGLWLSGWTGDNTGHRVVGRECNRVLISYSQEDVWLPGGLLTNVLLFQKAPHVYVPYYQDVRVHCLTPGSRKALACGIEVIPGPNNQNENFLAIDVCEFDDGTGKAVWQPGVHLFLIGMTLKYTATSATMATAIIDRHVQRVNNTMGVYPRGMTPDDPPVQLPFGAMMMRTPPAPKAKPAKRKGSRETR